MKRLIFLLLVIIFSTSGCASTYVITTRDIKGGVVSVLKGKGPSIRRATLTIRNNTELDVVVDFNGDTALLGAGDKIVLSYPFAGLMGIGQIHDVPIIITAPDYLVRGQPVLGLTALWRIHGSVHYSNNAAWLLERRVNQLYLDP